MNQMRNVEPWPLIRCVISSARKHSTFWIEIWIAFLCLLISSNEFLLHGHTNNNSSTNEQTVFLGREWTLASCNASGQSNLRDPNCTNSLAPAPATVSVFGAAFLVLAGFLTKVKAARPMKMVTHGYFYRADGVVNGDGQTIGKRALFKSV